MKSERAIAVSKLRWGIAGVSIFFSAAWLSLAGEDRDPAAFLVLGAGLFLGAGVQRSVERLLRGRQSSRPVAPAMPSMLETIETHSAKPELPARQRARFLGALGHELRNPLDSVTGFPTCCSAASMDSSMPSRRAASAPSAPVRNGFFGSFRLWSTDRRSRQGRFACGGGGWCPTADQPESIGSRVRGPRVSVIGGVADGLPGSSLTGINRPRARQPCGVRHPFVGHHLVVVLRRRDTTRSAKASSNSTLWRRSRFVRRSLAIVERLGTPLSHSDALHLEVAVARSVIEGQVGGSRPSGYQPAALRLCARCRRSH